MIRKIIAISVLFTLTLAFKPANNKVAYRLFNGEGVAANYADMFSAIAKADVVLFGELHNNPIAHWLQLELTQDLYRLKDSALVLGAEMFEADNQLIIDEYLQDKIQIGNFESEARLWSNYKTDYKPLLTFAHKKKLSFIATNIPRRYAAMVHKKGFESLDSLSDLALQYLPPLPIAYDATLGCYLDMLEMMKHMKYANENLPKAQAIKDATMAWNIVRNWQKGKLFLHYSGAYHIQNKEGIVWYLKRANPDLNIMTISTVEQANLDSLKAGNYGVSDYIITVDKDMTKTY